jgi:hypothetical protein
MAISMTSSEHECEGNHAAPDHDVAKMPGHWVLARLGKRVLRPRGIGLTRQMLAALRITPADHVVEFAPGMGVTAQMTLQTNPASYTAIERDESAGRYGIHELRIAPNDIPEQKANEVRRSITDAIKHQALPLTARECEALLTAEGFEVEHRADAPMALLNPGRLVRDEGFFRTLRFGWRVRRDRAARRRVIGMRRTFRTHRRNIAAICLVARKPAAQGAGA